MPLAEVFSTDPETRGNVTFGPSFIAKCPTHGELTEKPFGLAKFAIRDADKHNKEFHPRQYAKSPR